MEEVIENKIFVSVPLATPESAELLYEVLNVDKELKGSGVHREISFDKNTLQINFFGADLKRLRVAVNASLKNILLIVKTINQFQS